jgi:coenzyme F420-0:L-glutamate ligase/coenzyme F420-1:gamma-L-glutamate ligase
MKHCENKMSEIKIIGLLGVPEIRPGNKLGEIIVTAIRQQKVEVQDNDIIVVTSKIVSKAEGRLINLAKIKPSSVSLTFGKKWMKDPRHVEITLSQSQRIIRMDRGIIIAETKHGFICANAGVDQSNVGAELVALLPTNPDRSAGCIRRTIKRLMKLDVAVVISDTFGRPWREGQVDVAVGVSGLKPLIGYHGLRDRYGFRLKGTNIAVADELASAAELVMGKLDQIPVAIVKGYQHAKDKGSFRDLIRHSSKDLFR